MIAAARGPPEPSRNSRDAESLGERERFFQRVECELDAIAACARRYAHFRAERASERLAEPLGRLDLVGVSDPPATSFFVRRVVAPRKRAGALFRLADRPSLRGRLARKPATRIVVW